MVEEANDQLMIRMSGLRTDCHGRMPPDFSNGVESKSRNATVRLLLVAGNKNIAGRTIDDIK